MRLATLDDGTRDGQLVLVDRAHARCLAVPGIAPSLQRALDDWESVRPLLEEASGALDRGKAAQARPFDAALARAPLPRAYQWIDASGYLSHIERVRRARGAAMPPGFREEPVIYQGLSDRNLAWCEPLPARDGWGADFEGELAVIVGDVPQGVTPAQAAAHIRLLVLLNDISLRELIPGELAKGFGFFQSKPASAYAPLALTPDEFGAAWDGRVLSAEMRVQLNGRRVGQLRTGGAEQHFSFPEIIAYACRTRSLAAGTIVGAGTVANADESRGAACLAEVRVLEQLNEGQPRTPWLRAGDRLRISVADAHGAEPFGAIEQAVVEG